MKKVLLFTAMAVAGMVSAEEQGLFGKLSELFTKGRVASRKLNISDLKQEARRLGWQVEEKHNSHKLGAPLTFDAATNWATCAAAATIRDQGAGSASTCKSSYAFAAAGMLEWRKCILDSAHVQLSPQNLIDCDFSNAGCSGGWLTNSLNYLIKSGTVLETCNPLASSTANFCLYRCATNTDAYTKYYCKWNTMKLLTSETAIKDEISTNGPMMMAINAYADFVSLAGATTYIYDGTSAFSHIQALQVVGWNNDGTNDYWIVQNSWGTGWGNSGFANIKIGE